VRNIKLDLGPNSYEIRIGSVLISNLGERLAELKFQDKLIVITNPVVNALHGEKLRAGLCRFGFSVSFLEVPDGEESKSLIWADKLYTLLSECKAERRTAILALGGGVIGDLAGFVAATYFRGIPFIQIPTTLLAQVDSSIGGKTAINHGNLKNNVGVFYQPKAVFSDLSVLKTLPDIELKNGLAEVIKYGVIWDLKLFEFIESNLKVIMSLEESIIEHVIARCAEIKAEIVQQDEREDGLRAILNFGHTVGHGIESSSNFRIKHGYAVSIGMAAAARISHEMGFLGEDQLNRMVSLLKQAGLPVNISGLDTDMIMMTMTHDKKADSGKIRFILPDCLGKVFLSDKVEVQLIKRILGDMSAAA
jgi:3-dehydroquinate synthase